jgi:N,N'-diacetyllegionaminate synthase
MSSTREIQIGSLRVGDGADVLLIAEVANTHDGNLNTAHAYIDAVKGTGAQAIKFQTHIADAEGTAREPFRTRFSHLDKTRADYWRRIQFTAEQWNGLKTHAEDVGLMFLSSPFSPEAVELLDKINVPAWKIGSGETSNLPMLEQMARTRKPILISSGMSPWAELDAAVEACRRFHAPHAVFHCTSMYPTPPEKTGLNVITQMMSRYDCPVGLSDHSGDVFASLAAVALGADIIEVHVCLSRQCFGPDVPVSLTPVQIEHLSQGIRKIRTMLRNPIDKDAQAAELEPLRRIFNKSIVFRRDLPAGTVLTVDDLAGKKPGDGISVAELPRYIGSVLRRDVQRDEPLAMKDLT